MENVKVLEVDETETIVHLNKADRISQKIPSIDKRKNYK